MAFTPELRPVDEDAVSAIELAVAINPWALAFFLCVYEAVSVTAG